MPSNAAAFVLTIFSFCAADSVSVSYPLPGTPFYERVKAQLGDKQNWVDSGDLDMMFRATYQPEFYRVLHALVHAEFRARRAARRFAGPSPRRGFRARDAAAAAYHAARIPLLRYRLNRCSREAAHAMPASLIPVLSPEAAAVPTDQARA